jgi:hypothetical protein
MIMTKLAEAILDRRVQSPNYFQGRLLAASDLVAERDAHLVRQRMLGRAIGQGIVEGLWVAKAAATEPAVTVSKGLAINAEGQLLSLAEDQTLALTEVIAEDSATAEACLFKPCDPPETAAIPTGEGFYLLVMSPTSRYEETAPMRALQTDKASPSCGRKWAVPGVSFRLQSFNPLHVPELSDSTRDSLASLLTDPSSPAALSRLRNLIAHVCLGSDAIPAYTADPWVIESGAPLLASYGTVDYLHGLDLVTDCDLPLALIYWTGKGLQFVDCWAVRRRPVPPALSTDWPSLSGQRLRAENEARLLQFQDHIATLLAATTSATLQATDYFRFLPAAGLLPVQGTNRLRGFTYLAFFTGKTFRDPTIFIDGSRLRALIDDSFRYPPVDLSAPEMVWIYHSRENYQPPIGKPESDSPPYAIFASSHLPFAGTARFDVNHWDYSNFGLI